MTAHIHAKEMLLYAQDAAHTEHPELLWQYQNDTNVNWTDCIPDVNPGWHLRSEYRHKPTQTSYWFNFYSLRDEILARRHDTQSEAKLGNYPHASAKFISTIEVKIPTE